MTARLKQALEDSVADPDRLHRRLFFALCRDLADFAALENSVEAATILDLVSDYATGEGGSPKVRRVLEMTVSFLGGRPRVARR